MRVTPRSSPNFNARRGGAVPDLVVLHYTAMKTAEGALERLCDPVCEVSAHYLIGRDGTVFQLVPEEKRAWHAGAGTWAGVCDVNSRSVGIELDNDGNSPFSAPMFDALESLLPLIMARWSIPPHRVIGHSDMAFPRKSDPGPRFDWRRLALQGLSVWPESDGSAQEEIERFGEYAEMFGYDRGGDDPTLGREAEHALLNAFRARFRPDATGPLDVQDVRLIEQLARRFPVDGQGIKA